MRAAASAPVPVRVIAGVADRLPLADGSVDAAVASLVLCSVPDQNVALSELRRVLRAGGELRFYEHVIARSQPKRLLLQVLDHSGLWPAVAGGCHPARDTAAAIEHARLPDRGKRADHVLDLVARAEDPVPARRGAARTAGRHVDDPGDRRGSAPMDDLHESGTEVSR